MTLDNPYLSPSPPRFNNAVEMLNRLQTEFMSDMLKRAVGDAGAAMMHQLGEPLTALLFHLHEIRRVGEFNGTGAFPASLCEIVDMALRETERVCDILQRDGKAVESPVSTEAAVARGRGAIDAWGWNSPTESVGSPGRRSNPHPLTPREHEVLALITNGCSNKEGGHRLGISTRTFEAHRAHLMGKLGTRNAADLVRVALSIKQQR